MTDAFWLGVDIGTQSAKAAVVDDDGRQHGSGTRPLRSHRDGVRHEQSPTDWVDAAAGAISDALAGLADADDRRRVRAVAVCSTSGTVAALDPGGRPVTAGVMYDDLRGAPFAERAAEADPDLWERLGYRVQPSWALCTIAWIAARHPLGAAAGGARVVHQGDIVAEAMAGHPVATDWSTALKTGYDTHRLRWPVHVLDTLGIAPDALPAVVAPGTPIGQTSRVWEERTGLPAGTAIIAGMTDGCAAQLGAGALGTGDWHSVLGTTLVLKGVSDHAVHDAAGTVYAHRAPDGPDWYPGGASNSGAGVLSALLPGADLASIAATAERRLANGARPAIAYPIGGRGERFPFLRDDAEGFVVLDDGMRPLAALADLDPADAYLAVAIGVACVERLCFDRLAELGAPLSGRFSSSGGGSRSVLWNRVRASLLDRPLAIPESAEASLGMAVLAAWGHGSATGSASGEASGLVETARRMSRVRAAVDPDPGVAVLLDERYGLFRAQLDEMGWMPR